MGHGKKEHHSPKHSDHKVGKLNNVEKEANAPVEATQAKPSLPERLRVLRSTSEDAWGDLKTGVGNAYGEIRRSVKKVVNRYEQALR